MKIDTLKIHEREFVKLLLKTLKIEQHANVLQEDKWGFFCQSTC